MTNYDKDQPREPATGQFAEKHHSAPEATLAAPVSPFTDTLRKRRGHDFYPRDIASWPPLYANENTPLAEVPFSAHYFVGGADWYVSEVDQETGEAFGYADLGVGAGEFGYFSLPEMEAVVAQKFFVVERDLDFEPGTLAKDCISKYAGDTA